jgi:nucleoside-diphosphate-sugar epimerase
MLMVYKCIASKSANYPGERLDLDNIYMGCVDVRDVVHSLIMLYENPSAQGRHLCIESVERLVDLANKIADLYPEYPVQR